MTTRSHYLSFIVIRTLIVVCCTWCTWVTWWGDSIVKLSCISHNAWKNWGLQFDLCSITFFETLTLLFKSAWSFQISETQEVSKLVIKRSKVRKKLICSWPESKNWFYKPRNFFLYSKNLGFVIDLRWSCRRLRTQRQDVGTFVYSAKVN